jgi:hypothetical protein
MVVWLRSLQERLAVYLYPICCLLLLEYLMRSFISTKGTLAFIGPTLAALGISFVLPLTIRRLMTKEQLKERLKEKQEKIPDAISDKLEEIINREDELGNIGVSIQLDDDMNVPHAAWLLTSLLFTPVWAYALYLSIKFPEGFWWVFPCSCYPGFFNYVVGFGLAELREMKVR